MFIDHSVQVKKFQVGTVKAYLASLRHMYHYLLTENFTASAESKQRIQATSECVSRWIKAYRKESARRGLEKMDSDFSKLITPQQITDFEKSSMAGKAIKLVSVGMENRLSQTTQSEYVSVRDFVITEIALNNASRSGAIANMTLAEFTGARIVGDQHVVSVAQHKTAHCYGPAQICLSATHFAWLQSVSVYFVQSFARRTVAKFFSLGMGSRCPVDRCHVRLNPHGTRPEWAVTSHAPSFAKLQSRPYI